jgi:hypothetical protein
MAKHALSIGHEVIGPDRFPGLKGKIVVKTLTNGSSVRYEPLGDHRGTIPHQDLERFASEKKISMTGLDIAAGHERVVHDVESQEVLEPRRPHNFSVIQVGNEKRFHVFSGFGESEKGRLRKLLNP